jgi:hypothetical protein
MNYYARRTRKQAEINLYIYVAAPPDNSYSMGEKKQLKLAHMAIITGRIIKDFLAETLRRRERSGWLSLLNHF